MQAAIWPREQPQQNRMLVLDTNKKTFSDHTVKDLAALLQRGDVLICNDASTLPASLHGAITTGAEIELRLLQHTRDGCFTAVLFGAGSWRQKTEERPSPPRVWRGDVLRFGEQLSATVEGVDRGSPRLIEVRFHQRGAELYQALYKYGRPVQYSYLQRELPLWHVQNSYAGRPWSVELPSAGHSLTFQGLLALQKRGVSLLSLTHAAGLSSTGDEQLDARLPLPERYDIPEETVKKINEAKREGRRVIAVGTSVTRALESNYLEHGELRAGEGVAHLLIREGFVRSVVDALFTGMHAPQESHYDLLLSFAPRDFLRRAYQHAEQQRYLGHEFGDTTLILPGA
jgi:S-adenosylmethionine:tRNA ribosyltransferase-isomerase